MGHIDRILFRIADDIDRCGIHTVEEEIAGIVSRARDMGITGPVIDVLADSAAPGIARARAFGLVATRLASRERTPVRSTGLATAGV